MTIKSIFRKKYNKYVLLIILLIIIYLLGGALIPFMSYKEVNQDFKNKFDVSDFYGDGQLSVDRVNLVESSQDALDSRIHMLNEAKDRIILTSFSIKHDRSCWEIFSTIMAAARRGVKVQILGDGLSCGWDMADDPMYYALGTEPNIEIRFYNTMNLLKPWTINGRMHDKYIIIDDKMLLTGGRNISNYFLGEYNPNVLSYDRDVFVYNTAAGTEGASKSVIFQAEEYFYKVWDSSDTKRVFYRIPPYRKKEAEKDRNGLEKKYLTLEKNRPKLFETDTDYEALTVPVNKITLISNPINITGKEPLVWYQLSQLMENADDRVYIQTPYAVLNRTMYESFEKTGKNVKQFDMILNSVAGGDNFMASSDYVFNRSNIIETGISLHEYQGDYSAHNKSILIDDRISIAGSYNLDLRSSYIDTETMLVIDSREFNQLLEYEFERMEEESLSVKADGSYDEKVGVQALQIPFWKKGAFAFTSILFQLFRYLI